MAADRLYGDLTKAFGKRKIFMDFKNIEPGANFIEQIENAIESCGVVIVLIGPNWIMKIDDADHQNSGSQYEDFVMLEIASALKHKIPILPILLDGAIMPSAKQMPTMLKPLAEINAFVISARWWKYDVNALIAFLGDMAEDKWEGKARNTATAIGFGAGVFSSNALLGLAGSAGLMATMPFVIGTWLLFLPAGGAATGYLAYKGAKKLLKKI